jgi:hypothetical protein
MEQRWNGLPVFQGETVAAFTASGELLRMSSGLTAGLEAQALETAPKVPAAAAVVAAAASLDVTVNENELTVIDSSPDGSTVVFNPVGPFEEPIKVTLEYFPMDSALATLAWSMVLWQQRATSGLFNSSPTG